MIKQLDKLPFEGCIYDDYEDIKKLLIKSGRIADYTIPKEVSGLAWNANYVWYFSKKSSKYRYYKYQFIDLLNKENKQELNNNLILLKCEKLKNLLLI